MNDLKEIESKTEPRKLSLGESAFLVREKERYETARRKFEDATSRFGSILGMLEDADLSKHISEQDIDDIKSRGTNVDIARQAEGAVAAHRFDHSEALRAAKRARPGRGQHKRRS